MTLTVVYDSVTFFFLILASSEVVMGSDVSEASSASETFAFITKNCKMYRIQNKNTVTLSSVP